MDMTLYSKDVSDNIRVWSIECTDDGLFMRHGVLDGSMQELFEEVREGKGGRTKEGQIYSRYLSRINAQTDKGYVESLDAAMNEKRTNAIGLLRPMLAKPIKNVKHLDYSTAFYQHKYDGNRCLVTRVSGVNIAYSRNGKVIKSIGHIIDEIELDEGQTIDGELYCHGVSLQKIGSWIKREQEATLNLSLRVYDIIEDKPYRERLETIQGLSLGDNASTVPTLPIEEKDRLEELLRESLDNGYEGGIVRWGNAGYEDGKRSNSLAKVKVFDDDEFLVVKIIRSREGWARLRMVTKEGVEFGASAPGSMVDKHYVADNQDEFLGRTVTVKYMGYTKDKKPFHPVALRFRNKLAE